MPLDPDSPIPAYRQIVEQVTERIRSGRYPPGSRLPSQAEFMDEYGVARMTLVSAVRVLASQGWIVSTQGRGTFVRTDITDEQRGDTVGRADVLALADDLETSVGYRAMSTDEVIRCVADMLRQLAG